MKATIKHRDGKVLAKWNVAYWEMSLGDVVLIGMKPFRLISCEGTKENYVIFVDNFE